MRCVVLCGGLGTRLHALTRDEIPKVLQPVAGRPFLDWKLDNLRELGHDEILLLAGHLGEHLEPYNAPGCEVIFGSGMGRGLDLFAARDVIRGRYWLTYGDTLLDYPREEIEAVDSVAVQTTWRGVDYGAMVLPVGAFYWHGDFETNLNVLRRRGEMAEFPVETPWHHINTPEDLAETEAWLSSR